MPDTATTPNALTPAATLAGRVVELAYSLADRAASLPDLRAQLVDVRRKMGQVTDEYSDGISAVTRRYSAAMSPLSAELKVVVAAIETAEAAEVKLTDLAALLNPPIVPPVTPPSEPIVAPEPEPTPIEPTSDTSSLAGVAVVDDDDGDDILFPLPDHTPELQESTT